MSIVFLFFWIIFNLGGVVRVTPDTFWLVVAITIIALVLEADYYLLEDDEDE